tara:strand:+ start:224 stop:460 length:237 start_codon:yes stop_codon:yes gene_type:complete
VVVVVVLTKHLLLHLADPVVVVLTANQEQLEPQTKDILGSKQSVMLTQVVVVLVLLLPKHQLQDPPMHQPLEVLVFRF